MYLLLQMAAFLFTTFVLGIAVGYALWRSIGEREVIARYNAAEMRLAAHLARIEGGGGPARLQQREAPAPGIAPGMSHHMASHHLASSHMMPQLMPHYATHQTLPDPADGSAVDPDRLRLAQHFDDATPHEPQEFVGKQVAVFETADATAFRNADAAPEPRRVDAAGKLG